MHVRGLAVMKRRGKTELQYIYVVLILMMVLTPYYYTFIVLNNAETTLISLSLDGCSHHREGPSDL